ncbi:MAG: hypothetical protein PHD11_02865 [Bacteroidales bacterium]|nr:hypothetical protein [Bacteroidales bacterium]MDD4670112.1 hypothetical protein [Bacteroidales bacterium]
MKRVYIVAMLLSGIILLMASCEKEQDMTEDKYIKKNLIGEWALISSQEINKDTVSVLYVVSFDKNSVKIRMPELVGNWPFLFYTDGKLLKSDLISDMYHWEYTDDVIFVDTPHLYPVTEIKYEYTINNSNIIIKDTISQQLREKLSGTFPIRINKSKMKFIDGNQFKWEFKKLNFYNEKDDRYIYEWEMYVAKRITR